MRRNIDGRVKPFRRGFTSTIAFDPIEKKPLAHFHPGSQILSVGMFGCNMRCSFCQNHEIALCSEEEAEATGQYVRKEELVRTALRTRDAGNIGIAFTYNEPLVNYEWVKEVFYLARKHQLETVLITNGNFNEVYISRLLPLTTAWNIDLKCFTETGYKKLGGSLETVKKTIELASESAHVEVTTLIVPGLNDKDEEVAAEAAWLASLNPEIPLHLNRFFPRHRSDSKVPTPTGTVLRLASVARQYLKNVHVGNI